ncbi:MAG: hypothetical protein ACREVR_19305 [Burkholderiales bacterium]
MGDLPERADPHRIHQHLEDVPVLDHGLLAEHIEPRSGAIGLSIRWDQAF